MTAERAGVLRVSDRRDKQNWERKEREGETESFGRKKRATQQENQEGVTAGARAWRFLVKPKRRKGTATQVFLSLLKPHRKIAR